MRYFLLLVLLIVGVGCRSYPKRDLSTPEGAMAAYFNRKSEDVKKLNTAGFSNEEIAGILLITSSTHLSQKSVIEQMKDKTLEEIAGEAGIEAEEFQTIRGQALEELLKY